MASHRTLTLLLLLVVTAGCSQSVIVRTQTPGAEVELDGKDVGEVPKGGAEVDVSRGYAPVPYTIRKDGAEHHGEVERGDLGWRAWVLYLGGGCGALHAAPLAIATGFFLANPILLFTPFNIAADSLLGQNLNEGLLFSAIAAPTWLTIPYVVLLTAGIAAPLGLLIYTEELPDEFVVGPKWDAKANRWLATELPPGDEESPDAGSAKIPKAAAPKPKDESPAPAGGAK